MDAPPLSLTFRLASWLFRRTMPRLSGRWFYILKIDQSSYAPYRGMLIQYAVDAVQEGNWIHGRAEKIAEAGRTGTFTYLHHNRVQAAFNGVIKFSFLKCAWRVELIVSENGHRDGRPSHGAQTLSEFDSKSASGTFTATAADNSGYVYWMRDKKPLPEFA